MQVSLGNEKSLAHLPKLFSFPNDTCTGKITSKKCSALVYPYCTFNLDYKRKSFHFLTALKCTLQEFKIFKFVEDIREFFFEFDD